MPTDDKRKRPSVRKQKTTRTNVDDSKQRKRARFAKGVLLVLTLLVCVVPVALVAHPISYIPLIMVVLLIAISFAYLQVLKQTFGFSEDQMQESCERGREIGLNVTLSNRSILPHARVDVAFFITDIFGEYDAMRHMIVPLGPRETSTFDFDARFNHLGRYEAGVDHIVLYDLLGLFSARIENGVRRRVIVRPRLFDFYEPDISQTSEQEDVSLLKPITSDSMDYASVREYHYGDPLKTVHWNLTARSANGTMYTRLFEVYVSPSLSIVIDPFSDSTETEELMSLFDGVIESAASFSNYARAQNIECKICYVDRHNEPARTCLASDSDADELVLDAHRIAPIGPSVSQASIPIDMLRAEGIGQQGASNVAFATSRINDEIISTLIEIASVRRNPILLLTVPATLIGRKRTEYLAPLSRLSSVGVAYFILESTELETRRVPK